MTKVFVQLLAVACLLTAQTLPAQAAPQIKQAPIAIKAAYPSGDILGYAYDKTGRSWPIRRGFYNSTSDLGFGFDKAYHKHRIQSFGAINFAVGGLDRVFEGTNVRVHAYANKIVCGVSSCQATESIQVRTILNPNYFTTYHGQNVGGTLGLQTIYCVGYNPLCPSWVTAALDPNLRTSAPTSPPSYLTHEKVAVGTVIPLEVVQAQVDEFAGQQVAPGPIQTAAKK